MPVKRRMMGPAMPPKELLAAAAAAAAAMQALLDPDMFELVGPPAPELLEEMEAVPQNEREAEVGSFASVCVREGHYFVCTMEKRRVCVCVCGKHVSGSALPWGS